MRTSNSTSVEMQSLSKKPLIFFLILFSLLLCMFLWSYFIFPLITVSPPPIWHVLHNNTRHWTRLSFTVCSLYPSVTFVALHTVPYVLRHMSLLFCRWWCISMLHHFIFSIAVDTLSFIFFFFFFFLEVPSQYLLQQWPIFPTGIIKTSSRYLYTYTNLLPSSSPSHLSPNSPWSFSPQRLFFSHRVSTVV